MIYKIKFKYGTRFAKTNLNKMVFAVVITENYQRMSEAAAYLLMPQLTSATVTHSKRFNLGVAEGKSPQVLKKILTDKQEEFNPNNLVVWSLDDYVSLPEQASNIKPPYYSFAYSLRKNFLDNFRSKIVSNFIAGYKIDQARLEEAIEQQLKLMSRLNPEELSKHEERRKYITLQGYDNEGCGKAIIIGTQCTDSYLRFVQDSILNSYIQRIAIAGGLANFRSIDSWVIGIGTNGHIGFHESGIELNQKVLLVRLDETTRANAWQSGAFSMLERVPKYGVTLGAAALLRYTKNILLLANGEKKAEPVARSIVGYPERKVPASKLQEILVHQSYDDRNVVYVLDDEAAQGIIRCKRKLESKGIHLIDARDESLENTLRNLVITLQ